MFTKPSALVLEGAKEFLNNAIATKQTSGYFGSGSHPYAVSCCLFAYKEVEPNYKFSLLQFQGCHASVSHGYGVNCHFLLDHIQDLDKPSPPEQEIAFLQYVMDHPVFKDSFWEHDAEKAIKERIMVRRLDKLPSNVMMFCLILTRALWENFQYPMIKRFSEFLKLGLNGDEAILASVYFKINEGDGSLKYSPIISGGHTAFSCEWIGKAYVKNYLNYKVDSKSSRTICEGGNTREDGACVDNVFDKGQEMIPYREGRLKMMEIKSVEELKALFTKIAKEAK